MPADAATRLAVGLSALAGLVALELLLAALLQGLSPAAYVASRDPVSGSAYALGLVAFGVMPWVLGRLGQR